MKVSLVIPTYNREKYLVDTLRCAFHQDFESFEIIVVDQTVQHEQETLDFLHQHQDRMIYVKSSVPSLTAARNLGVESAKGELIIMVDDDTLFEPNFIREHWKGYTEGFDMISGRVDEGLAKTARYPVWFNRWGRYRGSENCRVDGRTNKFAGCNGSFRKTLFYGIQGFDVNFIGMANCEDADFGYRAYKAGYKVGFKASAKVIHRKASEGGVGNRTLPIYLHQAYYQNRLYFTLKNFNYLAVLLLRIRFAFKAMKASQKLVKRAFHEAKELI